MRFEDASQLEQFLDEAQAGAAVESPAQYIGIEDLPASSIGYVRAEVRTTLDQALGNQHPHRLSVRGTRHAEVDSSIHFLRQQRTDGSSAAQNRGAELAGDSAVNRR